MPSHLTRSPSSAVVFVDTAVCCCPMMSSLFFAWMSNFRLFIELNILQSINIIDINEYLKQDNNALWWPSNFENLVAPSSDRKSIRGTKMMACNNTCPKWS